MSRNTDLASTLVSEINNPDDSNDNSTDDNSDENVENIEVSKEFQENVLKFVKIDDLKRKKREELTELSKQHKKCEEYILTYLEKIDQSTVEISDGTLKKNKSETKTAINQDLIRNTLMEKVKDPKLVEEILKTMDDKRQMSTHVNLKRVCVRKPKGKKVKTSKADDK
jgi:hypothetical protein